MALFGRELEEFSTYQRSISSSARLVLGEGDLEELQEVGRLQAGIWFWVFNILMVNIMLNMVIAIVMDSYVEVKSSLKDAETLSSQAAEIYSRWKRSRQGKHTSLNDIVQALDPSPLDHDMDDPYHVFTVKELVDLVPGLSEEQAAETLDHTNKMIENELRYTDGDTMNEERMSRMEAQTQKIVVGVEKILEKPNTSKEMETVCDRMAKMEAKLQHVDERVARIEGNLQEVNERGPRMEGNFQEVNDRVARIEEKLDFFLRGLAALSSEFEERKIEGTVSSPSNSLRAAGFASEGSVAAEFAVENLVRCMTPSVNLRASRKPSKDPSKGPLQKGRSKGTSI
eukprot:gnl/MRDRNA2_/MRDRNA2_75302_c0_seq1.p1 gnl/MRDRNA2_/MRDRNA2_75302_c0~~gnl/MRDRNA2_/MRDRNA2_75302_c0_seq1.p1  ORF type:complete len:354 (-),score=72.30 gnl/MRDRNA2_/MRDRNA2_75302_c0_seq1:202-1224(-)